MPVLTFNSIFRRRPPARTRLASGASLLPLLLLAVMLPALVGLAPAVTLRGSRASVDHAHQWAVARGLVFQRSERSIERAVVARTYVRLSGGGGGGVRYRLSGVSIPYALPATAAWVRDLAPRFRQACRETLVVTSAIRPTERQLFNGVPESVHPTGLAIDLRKPRGRCRTWLRTTLLAMERRGTIDATEERFPAHFHVVVFGARAAPAKAAAAKPAPAKAAPARPAPATPAAARPATVTPDSTPPAPAAPPAAAPAPPPPPR